MSKETAQGELDLQAILKKAEQQTEKDHRGIQGEKGQ